jgi:heterodisulfide reductase subunit A-like polyferredoxin
MPVRRRAAAAESTRPSRRTPIVADIRSITCVCACAPHFAESESAATLASHRLRTVLLRRRASRAMSAPPAPDFIQLGPMMIERPPSLARVHEVMNASCSLNTLAANPKHVVVIGAGTQGISTAYWLGRAGHRVTVIDKQPIDSECAHAEQVQQGRGALLVCTAMLLRTRHKH